MSVGDSAVEIARVGVIVDRVVVDNPWCDHRWTVAQVLAGVPESVEPWTVLSTEPGRTRYFAGAAEIALYPRETDTLRYNIEDPAPKVYVFLRASETPPGIALLGATACPGEAHAHADTGTDLVEAVPMPAPILGWVRDFIHRHHIDRPVYRRRRDRADPQALSVARPDDARRRRIAAEDMFDDDE
jgi:hypothetical protein